LSLKLLFLSDGRLEELRVADWPSVLAGDTDSPVVLARVIERGSMDAVARLVSPAAWRRELPRLVVPEHVRRFGPGCWTRCPEARDHPEPCPLTCPPIPASERRENRKGDKLCHAFARQRLTGALRGRSLGLWTTGR